VQQTFSSKTPGPPIGRDVVADHLQQTMPPSDHRVHLAGQMSTRLQRRQAISPRSTTGRSSSAGRQRFT
jgi:hypothetical protein